MNFTNDSEPSLDAAIQDWMDALDGGDLDALIDCCDPDIVIANHWQPTKFGLDEMRTKFAPQMAAFTMQSTIDVERTIIDGDIAIVVGGWSVIATSKESGDSNTGQGRLLLNYRRNNDGQWKILIDMDNFDTQSEEQAQ